VFDSFGEVEQSLGLGRPLAPLQLHRLRQATTYATKVAADVVRFAYNAAGSDALRNPSALNRCFRDIYAGTQHIFVDDSTMTNYAQQLMSEHRP